jgi:hypothetical protein
MKDLGGNAVRKPQVKQMYSPKYYSRFYIHTSMLFLL